MEFFSEILLRPGQEIELVIMIIECCSQEKTYNKYYGLLAQRFCSLNHVYQDLFEHCFEKQFMLVHRLETNKLRNVSKMFAYLLGTDAISWGVLQCIRLTIEETNSSGRIFIKIIFQELAENMGIGKINERINNQSFSHWFTGILPKDTLANVRFSINFFTSIGLGGLTDIQRDYLDHLPNIIAKRSKTKLLNVDEQMVARSDIEMSSSSEYYTSENTNSSTSKSY
jgi:pre-mRNA-splicing factor CWC22